MSNKVESVSSNNTKNQKKQTPKHLTGHLWKMLGNKLIASVMTNKGNTQTVPQRNLIN